MDSTMLPELSGQQLVADYQSVFINMATSETARQMAEQSERMILEQLGQVSQGEFLKPSNLGSDWQAGLTRESINAHVKKAQAAQLNELSNTQLIEMVEVDTKAWVGKKVRITSLSKNIKPFDAVWFDKRTGYRTSQFTGQSISGRIQEVLLDKNVLIIKPLWAKHLLVPNLHLYATYIIGPDTLEPIVNISLA